jgi:hypothetical protein
MDITQLVISATAAVGILLVGVMAVVPSLLEAAAGRDAHRPARPGPASPAAGRPAARRGHRPVDLAA